MSATSQIGSLHLHSRPESSVILSSCPENRGKGKASLVSIRSLVKVGSVFSLLLLRNGFSGNEAIRDENE
ncbi:hypothetical protein [Leptospira wolffii]|uniref:hypothetical protein n=1 Tax=Leptospira wolffii TaxID=409998 RepID=UPI00031D86FB|nr:hypothetical protein [Leptospira wolffii]